ncbi:uncharacterized protein LOC117319770, partial [Pecten maximus]|uniref:uncharacterized protein LOC117319770 n=1 Tax=Pecten maximus TaxID=6579 RepID=UPI001458158E
LTYGRVKEIELDGSWDLTSSIDGTITVKTPIEGFNNLLFKMSHVGGVNGFRSSATAVYYMNQKIEIEAVFKNGATQEASAVFTSPFTSDFRASFLKSTEEATGEIYYDEREKLYTKITYSASPVVEGTFLLRSVIPGMETLNGALRHEVSIQTTKSHAEFTINGQTSQVDITYKNGFKKQGSIRIRTPITAIGDIGASFSHKLGRSILESSMQLNSGEQQVSAEVSLRWRNNIEGSFRVATPFLKFRNIRGAFTHSGTIQQFTCHADFQYAASKKLSGDITFSSINAFEGSVSLTTPFVGYETMTAAFRHDLSTENLSSHLEISYQPNQRLELDVAGSLGDLSRGQVTIKTPFAGYEETTGTFTQNLRPNGYEAHLEATYNQGQRLEMDLSAFPNEGRFVLRTPFTGFEEITAAFNKELTSDSVSGHAEATYQGQKMEVDITLSYSNGKLVIKTPVSGYEEMSVSYTHRGTAESFVFHADMSYLQQQKFAVDTTFSKRNGRFDLVTPFPGYEHISAAFTNANTGAELSGTAEVTYSTGKKIETEYTFSPVAGHLIVKTPFTGYEELTAAFTHQYTNAGFTGKVNVSPKPSEIYEISMDLSLTSGQLTVKTPLEGYEMMSAAFTNRITEERFTHQSELTYLPGRKLELDITISVGDGRIAVQTPFVGYEEMSAAFTHQMTEQNMDSSIDITYLPGQKIKVVASVLHGSGQVTITTPFSRYEEMSAAFSNQMTDRSITLHGEVMYLPGRKLQGDISLSPENGQITITTPYSGYEEMSAAFTNQINDQSIINHVEIHYQPGKHIESDISISPSEGNIVLRTPFTGYEVLSTAYRQEIADRSISGYLAMSYKQGEKFEIDISLSAMAGHLTVKTPFEGYRLMSTSFTTDVSSDTASTKFQLSLIPGEKYEADVSLSLTEGHIVVKTPITGYETFSAAYTLSVRRTSFAVHAEMTDPSSQRIEIDASASFGSRIKANVVVKTPFTGYERFGMTISHVMQNGNIQSSASIDYGRKIAVAATMRTRGGIISSLTVKTPFNGYELSKITFAFTKNDRMFTSQSSLEFGGQKGEYDASISYNPTIDASFVLKTPFNGFEMTSVTFQHVTSVDNQQVHGRVVYSNQKTIQFDMTLQASNAYIGSMSLNTPFTGFESSTASFEINLSESGLTSNIAAAVGDRRIRNTLSLAKTDNSVIGSINLQTPFDRFENMGLSLNAVGSWSDSQIAMSISYDETKPVEVLLKHSILGDRYDGSFLFRTLYTPELTASVTHNGDWRSFSNDLQMTVGTDNSLQHVTTFRFSEDLTDISSTFTGILNGYRHSMKSTFNHQGQINNFRTNLKNNFNGRKSTVTISFRNTASIDGSFAMKTPFKGLRNVAASLQHSGDLGQFTTRANVQLTPAKIISANIDFFNHRLRRINGNFELATPFEGFELAKLAYRHTLTSNDNQAEWNGEKMLDMDVAFGKDTAYVAALTMRAPRPVAFSSNGELNDGVMRGELNMNWNTESQDSNIIMEAAANDRSDSFTTRQDVSLTVRNSRKAVGVTGSLSKSPVVFTSSGNIIIDGVTKYGIDLDTRDKTRRTTKEKSTTFAIRLPSRTVKATGLFRDTYRIKTTEAAIFWDAERDETQKIGVIGSFIPQGQSTKTDFSVSFPSIGKNVKLDSEVTMNSGNILFDGKTEFSYSGDVNKNLVIHSRVEDLSSGFRKNYSFVVGVSHPASTIDVQLTSHIGHVDNKYSADMNLHYLTAGRSRKNFALMGEIDRMRKQMKVEMVSPVKSIKVSGQVRTNVPYKLLINNQYDESLVDAELVIDPSKLSMGFHMNYDIENPGKMFHAEAKYVNNSAIRAEVYREENTQRITDSLFAMRLNTSRMLHSRLHWRPSIVQDLKAYGLRRMTRDSRDSMELYNEIATGINEEVNSKYNIIRSALLEELKPYVQFAATKIRGMQQDVTSMTGVIDSAEVESRIEEFSQYLTDVVLKIENLASWMETAASTRVSYPMKDNVDMYIIKGSELLEEMGQDSRRNYADMMNLLDDELAEISRTILSAFKTYHDQFTNAIAQPLNTDVVRLAKTKYNEYLTKLTNQLPSVDAVAQKYTSALYNGREQINSALYGLLDRPEINYMHSQVAAAYKYWEVEENAKAAIMSVYDHILEIIEEEIESLKSVITDLEKTKITVFDPANGEVQTDTYLIVPMKSLKSLPGIDMIRRYNTIRSYIPDTSKWGSVADYLPSSDVSTWMPPFDVFGTVEGNTFTTFDGKTYQFNGRCSYVLAGDYMDGNFSIILDYMGKQKKRVIITTTQHAVQLLPKNKLRVDGAITTKPYHAQDISVINEGDDVTVSGRGFTVRHNLSSDMYEIGLSGWYYGKTGGLLGTYNNERYDDMMMASRQLTNDVTSFTDSWEVNDRCR